MKRLVIGRNIVGCWRKKRHSHRCTGQQALKLDPHEIDKRVELPAHPSSLGK